ncbi:GNAT family N-acetyltransferase [Streptomyces sp. NPDC004111]|uniref:GNAT family N-acetyltransferase n=1 Tax=Streptomyces sp. NPDC004111 TaxID=3364690 RepID=UPI0036D1CB96
MTWTFSENLDTYGQVAEPSVAARPAENTQLLTVAATLRRRGPLAFGDRPPLFGWWHAADGTVRGAVVWTPPHPLLVGTVPAESLAPLARACEKFGVSAVNADRSSAETLAAQWPAHRTEMRQRLYRLGELIPPSPAPAGHARTAGAGDRALLIAWYEAFGRDTGMRAVDTGAAVDDRLAHGGLTLWVGPEGVPVSMAGAGRPAAGAVRVGPVYTPPEQRGRGYGGAATAAVSAAVREAGAAEVLLFTDLANPTSNALYGRIGYRQVADRVVLAAP